MGVVTTDEAEECRFSLRDEQGQCNDELRVCRGPDGRAHFEVLPLLSSAGGDPGDGASPKAVADGELPGLLYVLGALPSRRIVEAVSWRLVAEVMRRHPGRLRLMEAHSGGGQYDQLCLYPRPTPGDASFLVSLNRVGSAYFGGLSGEPWTSIWTDVLAAEDPKDVVDEMERLARLTSSAHVPPSTPDVLTVRAIAALLAPKAFERGRWECRNGCLDSSGGDSGVRERLFAAFPLCRERRYQTRPDDLFGEPAYRFWFVLRDDEPVLAFEDNGLVWDRHEEQFNLVALRKAAGSLAPVVQALATRMG